MNKNEAELCFADRESADVFFKKYNRFVKLLYLYLNKKKFQFIYFSSRSLIDLSMVTMKIV